MNNRKSILMKTVSRVLMGLAFMALTLVLQLPMTAYAKGNQAVTYLDENGKEHTITSYNTLNVSDTSFGGGVWVTAMGAEGTAGTFKLTGDTVLIVTHLFSCDGIDTRGYNLTIYGDSNSASSPHVLSTKDFGICGKGTLTICSGCLDSHSNTPSFPALGCEGGTFIKGGRVKAVADAGSSNVPAIGGGKVVISGGDVNALNIDQNSSAAAIGGEQREDGDVTITGGNVTASTTYGVKGAAIGGSEGRRGVVKISGGTVKATTKAASSMGAAIGGGKGSGNDEITITGGNVYANTSGETPRFLVMSPAIGSGYDGRLGSVTITGGTVNAVSRGCNAIGSGFMNTTKQDIKITGGNVTARDANGSCSGIGTAFSSGKKLILGWTSTSDRINGGFVSSDYKSWNVAFSTGTYFWLGDTNYAATTSNLDGRTLIPSERSNICTASFYKYKSGKTSLHKEVSVGIGGKVSDPGDPYAGVGGYNFTAWKQGGYSGSTYDFGSPLTGNLELYADYTSSVTFRYGNDDPDKTVQVPRGSKLTKPADPASISGLILFKGWRKQGEDHEYDFNSVVYDPFTLEAIWEYEGVRYVGGKGVTNDYRTIDRITDNTLNSGDWVVERDITFDERVEVSGTVNLILTDGCTMTASKGITVQSGNTLNIFGQEGGTGNLVAAAESNTYCAGIGGASGNSGTIVIYSGSVKATGGNGPTGQTGGAGIGGAYDGFGYVTIHGGNVEGHGGRHSPGIGGSGANITITGGKVYGQGGYLGGGIGGASSCENIVIRISGGSVNGSAMMGCCGIGFGRWGKAKIVFSHGDGEIEVGDTSFGEVVFEEAFKLKDTETLADGKNLKGRTLVPCNAVYFNANGGSGKMSAVAGEYGDSYTIPACGFDAPAGKVFMCWQDSDGTEYQPGQEIMILKDLNLSAQWMALQDLSFESVTDENPSGTVVKTYGDGPFTNAVSGAKTTVFWQSSDNTVAQVGQDGRQDGQVTILKAGQVFITAVAEGTSEYAEGRASYLLTVEPKIIDDPALSIDQSYVYTGSTIIPDVTVKAGDTVIAPEEYEVIASDNVKAGTAGATISGTDSGNYIFTNVSPVGFTIDRKPVTVTGIKAKNKHYNGNTDVELDFSGVMIEGKVSGDNLEASAEGAFTDAEPGENKTVNIDIDTLTLTGKDKANYVLSDSGRQTAAFATIYAPHTVKFVNEDGTQTDIPDETVKNGEKATDPAAPLDKDGYLQVGWNLDGEQFDFDKPLDYENTVTLTLKPRFLKLHKVYEGAYVEAGGSGSIQWENSRHDEPTGSPRFVTEVAGETVFITATPDTGSVTAWFNAYYMEGGARIEIPCCMVKENEATFTVPEMPDEAEIYVTASFAPNDDMLNALTDPSDATGNTISVNSASQLVLLSNYMATPDDPEKPSVLHNMKDKTIKLTADIDVTGSVFEGFPQEISGTSTSYIFEGTFDGNGKTISGLNVDRGNDSTAGLFRAVGAAGRVQNLTVKGTVKGGGQDGTSIPHNVGGIAASNSGTIDGCTCLMKVIGDHYSRNGGVVGVNHGTISNCYYLGMGGENGTDEIEPAGKNFSPGTATDCTALYSVTGSDSEYDGVVTIESAETSGIEVDGYFEGGSDVTLTLSATDREGWTLDGFKYENNSSGEDVNLTERGNSYVLHYISQNVNILPDYIYNALKDLGQDDQNYYLIKTVADLEAVAQAVADLDGCRNMGFRLADDIDFEGEKFSGFAVGTGGGFNAVFDGDGHVIRNMVIETDAYYVGFVGFGETGEVKDLILEDCHVINTSDKDHFCAGMVMGGAWNSKIYNCRVIDGSVIGPRAGAIIGETQVGGQNNYYSHGVTVVSGGETKEPGKCGSPSGDVRSPSSPDMAVVAWTVRFLDGFNEAAMAAPQLVPDNETALRPEEDRIYPPKHEHYLFNGKWQREDGSEYTFYVSREEDNITEDTVLYSIWDEALVHTVTMTDSESDKTAQVRVYEDESGEGWPLPECFIAPAPGREFDKWKYGDLYYEMGDSITFTEDISIEAYWKDAEYRIVREDMEHGTVTAVETARYNETIRPGVTPDKGFSLDTLSCNTLYGKGVEIIDGSFTMPADDVSLSATFKLNDYTVTSGGSMLDHGVLWVNQSEAGDLSAPVTVHYGDEAAVLPDEGYALLSCTVTDEVSKPVPVSGGVFTVPDSDLTVTAVFIPEEEQEDCKHLHTEIRNVKTATCTEEGYSGDTYCKDCGNKISDGTATSIDPGNHVHTETRNAETATCIKQGYSGDVYCLDCGNKISDGTATSINPENHVHTETRNVKKATCTKQGYSGDIYCTDCGNRISDGTATPIDPENHIHTETRNTKKATCTEQGYSGDIYCQDCGNKISDGTATPIDPDNHDFDEGVVTKEPTHLCDGVKTATCKRCGLVSDSVPVPRLTDDEESNTLIEDLEQMEEKVTISENVIRKEDGGTETVVLINGKEISKTVVDADGNVTEVKTEVWTGGLRKSYRYTGAAIKPAFHVYDGVRLLREKTDYTVSYKNNKKVSTNASVTIKFKGNYKGSEPCTVQFTIEPAVIGEDVLVCDTAVAKTGKTIKPTLDILWAGTGKKVSAKEFVFTCTENREIKDPAVYTVSAAPKSGNTNFTIAEGVNNEASLTVTEKTNLLSKAKATLDPSRYYYNGDAIIPEKGSYTLTLNGKPLAEDTDYVVDSVLNNVNPGTATIVFVAKDSDAAGISGTRTATFKILKGTDITNDEKLSVGIKDSAVPYAKGGARPQVTVSYNGHRLTSGTDYTVKYGNNKAVTNGKTAEIAVSGKGNFKGKKIVNFEITSQTITALSANILIDDKVTSPKGYEDPKVTVTDLDGKTLKNGTDYELTNYREPDDSNTVMVDVVGKGNYKGTVSSSYRIIAKDRQLGKAGAEKIAPKAYTGEKIILTKEEQAKLLFAGKSSDKKYLVPGTDFEVVSYSDNVNAGTAKVTVRGLGNYGGLRTLTFKITGKKADWSGNTISLKGW